MHGGLIRRHAANKEDIPVCKPATSEVHVARARLTAARHSSAVVSEVGPEERRMARADIERMRQQLETAKRERSYCTVRAPFARCAGAAIRGPGHVLEVNVRRDRCTLTLRALE